VTEQSPKRQSAIAFSERLLGVAIDTVASSKVEITELGARDPKIVALALLCRTISNFKGAMVMVREDLIIEAQTLTRCCYENLIWIAALRDRGSQFVNDMLNDEAANLQTYEQAYQSASQVFNIVNTLIMSALNLGVQTAVT